MDKELMPSNHNISINSRKTINITGVKKVENFDDIEFLLETNMGYLKVTGKGLEIIKLDTYQGDLSIKGHIDGLSYLESNKKGKKEEGIISKLFK